MVLLYKSLDLIGGIILRNNNERDVRVRTICFVEVLERRHFLHTTGAPGSPEIDHYDLAL
jgi:hypothetical protein